MRELALALTLMLSTGPAYADSYVEFREAIRNGDVRQFRELVQTEEDIRSAVYNRGIDALSMAVGFESVAVAKDILGRFPAYAAENSSEAMTLACSANRQYRELIEMLIESGTSIDSTNRAGQNCLYSAVLQADYVFFEYLIDKGASEKVEITPDPSFGYSGSVTIEEFINDRLDIHLRMRNRITNQSSRPL